MLMEKILWALKNARAQLQCLWTPTDDVNNAHLSELDELINILESPNPSKNGFFYWTVQFGIQKTWVADGADFTDERVHDMLAQHFGRAYGYELKGEVLSRPPDEPVASAMGFKSVAEYLKDRKK